MNHATITCAAFPNVTAIPSVHGEMLFADAAWREVLSGAYDAVLLEFPRDVAAADLSAAVEHVWPAMGLAFIRGRSLGNEVFAADGARRDVNAVDCMVPISTCDSLIAALRACAELRGRCLPAPLVEFCDLPIGPDDAQRRPVGPGLPDPWYVREHGLAAYIDRNAAAIEAARIPRPDDPREAAMCEAVRRHAAAGRRVLFVCGLAHWPRISALLEQDAAPTPPPAASPARSVEAFPMRADEAWLLGFCGIPALAAALVEGYGSAAPFQLEPALAALRQAAYAEFRREEEQGLSVRTALANERYLAARLALKQRFCPRLDDDLAAAAAACVGDVFARTLKTLALRYPYDPPENAPQLRLVEDGRDDCLLAPGHAFRIPAPPASQGERRCLPERVPLPLTREECRRVRAHRGYRRYSAGEDSMQRGMMQRAWRLGEIEAHLAAAPPAFRAAPFEGDFCSGIDWRATLHARAAGADPSSLLVRVPTREPDPEREAVIHRGAECPIAWLFQPHAAVTSTAAGSFGPAMSSFYWIAETSYRYDGLIIRERLAYAASMLRGRIIWSEQALRAVLASLDDRQKPTVAPWHDRELAGFTGVAQCLGAAIRWAAARAIVVAPDDYAIPAAVYDYAARCGVHIIRFGWDRFPPQAQRRLALQHTLPCDGLFGHPDPRLAAHADPVPASLLETWD